MAKGFFISKTLGIVGIVLGLGAVATIITLSVLYSQEKQRVNDLLTDVTPSRPNAAITNRATPAGTIRVTTTGTINDATTSTSKATITGTINDTTTRTSRATTTGTINDTTTRTSRATTTGTINDTTTRTSRATTTGTINDTTTRTSRATTTGTINDTTTSTSKATTTSTINDTTASTSRATTAGPASTTMSKPVNPWELMRLPRTLMPTFYTVTLQPFLTADSQGLYIFKGRSTVQFKCMEPTNLIIIHSKKLNYTKFGDFLVSVRGLGVAVQPNINRTWLEEKTEYLVVQLNEVLQPNKLYELHSVFTGELADDLAGFYRSQYEEGNETKVLATTQMQAADARKAFPCFDEPAMKANFSITLIHLPEYSVLSNMEIKNQTEIMENGTTWKRTQFYPTLKMSTYLLGFIVSQFEQVNTTHNGTLIRVWGRPNAIKEGQGNYALSVTGDILTFFEKHYNIPYPLDKSDQVALPDFNAGAMENWGLITYRESALLFDPGFSSIGNKERIVTVIAHEVAHQWFGNLVTLEWWNELWLNEGFASYVEYLGADAAEPTWNITDLIVSNDMYRVMAIDALASSHPLSTPADEINTPAQISEVFDAISYSKGASVLRMLSEFLTEAVFKEGLHSYFMVYAYKNTVCDNLWEELQKVVNTNNVLLPDTIKSIMDRWTLQMGFPVLTVNTATGLITQNHFLLDPESSVTRPSQFNYTWIVPVPWLSQGSKGEMYWLTNSSAQYDNFSTAASGKWLLLNVHVTGYFRVNYDVQNWERLMNQLETNHQEIPVLNRAQIMDDAFNLARAKYISTELALNTTRYLIAERDYLPWDAALDNLYYFRIMFDRKSEVYGPMQRYIQKQVIPLFDYFQNLTLDWAQIPAGLMDQYNEILAINTACSYNVSKCKNLASSWFESWRADPSNNTIPPNLRSAIYCSAISTGNETVWDFGWEMFRKASVVSEADKLRQALACSQDPKVLQRYLEYTLDPLKIRRQDAVSTINSIANNVVGQKLAWEFVCINWKTLFNLFGTGSFSFSSLIQSVTKRFASESELTLLEQFKANNTQVGFGSATRALEQALERTNANIKWMAENKVPVQEWFERNS